MRQRMKMLRGKVAVVIFGVGIVAFAAPVAGAAPAPPSVTTGAVENVAPTSVEVTGTVDPHGVATNWYVEYGPNTTFTSSTTAKSAGSGSSAVDVTKTLSGLTAATAYDYRVVATNSAGTTFGAPGSFNTSAAPVVITGAASAITAYSAMLHGTVNPEALATTWYFEYSVNTGYGSKTSVGKLVAGPNPTNVSFTLTGLSAQSTYHYRLVAQNSAGTSVAAGLTLSTGLPVTLNTSESTVVYGGSTTLYGTVASGLAGEHVTLESEMFNQPAFAGFATVVTGASGAWSYIVKPAARTTYEAVVSGGTSSLLVVSVSPAVNLTRLSQGRLLTQVVAAVSFGNHVLQLQILSNGLWATWKHVRLNTNGETIFTTRLPKGVHTVRMAIAPFTPGIDQAAPGYLAGFSGMIRI